MAKVDSIQEVFTPNLDLEAERLYIVEQALSSGGLIENHLRWVEQGKSPSSTISDEDYGYTPPRYEVSEDGINQKTQSGIAVEQTGNMRPSREPIDFQLIATDVLGYEYDMDYESLVRRINIVEDGWFNFLVKKDLLDDRQAAGMRQAANGAYTVAAKTENNLPAYVATILGGFKYKAQLLKIYIPALEEWSRGLWAAEEYGHDSSMHEYGKITSVINSREHIAGRNSQLRAGMEVDNHNVIQLFAYVTWQELSTNIAHKRDGVLFGPVGHEMLSDIAADEARHHYLYLGVLRALFKEYPDDTVRILHSILIKPEMPGSKGIPNYARRSRGIHSSAVFGSEQVYQSARAVLKKLGLLDETAEITGLSVEGEQALMELRLIYKDKEARQRIRRGPFVLGKTITEQVLRRARKEYADSQGLPPRHQSSAN